MDGTVPPVAVPLDDIGAIRGGVSDCDAASYDGVKRVTPGWPAFT